MALKVGDRVEFKPAAKIAPATEARQRRWCAVEAHHRREVEAAGRIAELGFLAYVPQFKTEIVDPHNTRKRIQVDRPLFSGYLFAHVDPVHDAWGELERLRGVRQFVKADARPLLVPERLIERMHAEQGLNFGQPLRRRDAKAGDLVDHVGKQVRVTDGPLTGFFATLSSVDERGRIVALVDLFRRMTSIDLSVEQVERA